MAWKPASIARKLVRADGEHGGEPDGGVHRVAAADPVPEAEHVRGVDAELRDLLGIGRDRDEVLRDGLARRRAPCSVQSRAVCALVIVSSVVNVFDEMMNSVSAGSRSRVASAKSVPSTFDTKRNVMLALGVVAQRLVGHDRAEVRAADADVDDVPDALAGVAGPRAAPHALGEGRHLVEHRVDLGDDVLAVHHDRLTAAARAGRRAARRGLSVTLILSPRNMASMRPRRPTASASARRSRSVSSVTRCFE